jgi:excisionase family DNA binding protein
VTDRLLTARQLADYLGLAPGTILDKWERGDLPGFKFGRAVRFDLDEVLASGRRPGAGGEVAPVPYQSPGQRRSFTAAPVPVRGGDHDA